MQDLLLQVDLDHFWIVDLQIEIFPSYEGGNGLLAVKIRVERLLIKENDEAVERHETINLFV